MNQGLDPSLQRIIDSASSQNSQSSQSRLERPYDFPADRAQPAEWSFAPAPRQSMQDPMLLNRINTNSYNYEYPRPRFPAMIMSAGAARSVRDTFTYEPRQEQFSMTNTGPTFPSRGQESYTFSPRQTNQAQSTGPARFSLAPRSICNQQDKDPRAINNADHHFNFAQNLRQGIPIQQAQQKIPTTQMQSPISQLATNMLLQRPMPKPSPDTMSFLHSRHHDRLMELQPAKQQPTPPFNLSGFVYSPAGSAVAKTSASSSPPFASSPTVRVSQRRVTSRIVPLDEYIPDEYGGQDGYDFEGHVAPPKTPQEQTAVPVEDTFISQQRKSAPTHNVIRSSQPTISLSHAPPTAHGIQLVSPHELPDRFRQVFPYELFNAAQSKCFAPIYQTTDNVVVSAPTGSGKTALLELAICKLVEGHNSGEFKIVYQAPTKSLCAERVRDWSRKFSHLNLACAELTGDTSHFEMAKVRKATIIVTTPEKWDSITRKWADYDKLLQMVKLFLIDEVHILKDTRGATLEAVVSRMKTSSNSDVRFIALSATIPNSHDIALWLGKNSKHSGLPALEETFGEDFRPVKLQKHVHGFDGSMNEFAFDKVLDGKLPNLIQKYTHKKPIMVFCFTRKSCETTATILAEWWTRQRAVDRAWPAPQHRIIVGSKELQDLVTAGVAFHHAGLDTQDRTAIESAYLKGDISLICCTSTLAVGVNLPCHLVVLKGTVCYQDSGMTEYSDLEVMQMLGRAGRPQFDDSAVAIIMTRTDKVERYKRMISGQELLESTLQFNLIEHLNSEIGLGTIHSLDKAKSWLSGTFLNVRMRQNPGYYKFDGIPQSIDADRRLQLICERDIKLLQESQLVTEQGRISCTEYGLAMSRYMVQFETMKLLLSLPPKAKVDQILHLLCQASEFKDLRIKPNERPILRELNKSPLLKYPIKENVSTTAHKISLIIQVQLGGIDLPDSKEAILARRQFATTKFLIFERIQRLIRCIIDCKSVDCDAISTRHVLDLARSLSAEFWENSNLQLRQVTGIGSACHRKFVAAGVNSVEKLVGLDTASIERIVGKNPPYGRKMLDSLAEFPRLTLVAEIVGTVSSKPGENPKVMVKACLGFSNKKVPSWHDIKPSLTLTAETSDGTLVHFWRGNIQKMDKVNEFKFTAELCRPGDKITCYVACDEIVGTIRSFSLTPNVSASAFPPQRPTPKSVDADEYGGDDLDDEFLAAVKDIEYPPSENNSDEFPDIDEIDATLGSSSAEKDVKKKTTEVFESVQMANGKWTCNHHCRGGQPLKNGKLCKHKCCIEGLDKPRKLKKKERSSYGTGELPASLQQKAKRTQVKQLKPESSTGSRMAANNSSSKQNAYNLSQKKFKPPQQDDLDEVEVIDLAQEIPPVPFADLAPRKYPRLHKLPVNIQEDKSVRLPENRPQISYASGRKLDLSFMQDAQANSDRSDYGGDDGNDLPSLSELLSGSKAVPDPFDFATPLAHDSAAIQSIQDESMEIFETAMLGIEEPMPLRQRTPTPIIDSSFANGVFDFERYDQDEDGYSSPLMREARKRVRSPSLSPNPEQPVVKYQRFKKADAVPKRDAQPESSQRPGQPAWLQDMDKGLVEDFIGIVDFVD